MPRCWGGERWVVATRGQILDARWGIKGEIQRTRSVLPTAYLDELLYIRNFGGHLGCGGPLLRGCDVLSCTLRLCERYTQVSCRSGRSRRLVRIVMRRGSISSARRIWRSCSTVVGAKIRGTVPRVASDDMRRAANAARPRHIPSLSRTTGFQTPRPIPNPPAMRAP